MKFGTGYCINEKTFRDHRSGFMKKKCKNCLKIKDIKNFSQGWNKEYKKYYPSAQCRMCVHDHLVNNGFCGWTPRIETDLIRRAHGKVNDEFRNLWEKKADDISELYVTSIPKKNKKKINKNISALKNKYLKRQINSTHLNTMVIYMNIQWYNDRLLADFKKTAWDSKIDAFVKAAGREKRF